ncbi:hypothetical protein IE81DRAFT_322129 [Ceraceosorus guamensis]|uniref:Uncharacterized protein n=1 Tax=Ceraceosorus guamensis TaxID=1522189 RepID=A0A316W1R0_9BASI|nr:hypothetical protein IE81DRAFT_322129 [Ceraceosorus guamensis]PWN43720.1 hypothetical protein IE81DRAFT_322129 [Ceraceosorus guamensis]
MIRSPTSLLSGGSRAKSASLGAAGAAGLSLRAQLSARSRVTNLGVVLLLAVACASLLLNLRYAIAGSRHVRGLPPPGFGSWESFHGLTPSTLLDSLPPPAKGADALNHLVIVTGHAVWAGCDFSGRENDENWVLESWQRGGSTRTFWKHIEKGVEIADADPTALLVFSGGQTRPTSLQTEGESYFSLAVSSGMRLPVLPGFNFSTHGPGPGEAKSSKKITAEASEILGRVGAGAQANAGVAVAKGLQGVRMTTENFAMDSFENLLFSIARFREFTGRFPIRITVVGYGMKKSRFEDLHAKALRWPVKSFVGGQRRFHYVGIDDDGNEADIKAEYDGEKIKTYPMFEKDMYGCHGRLLDKRRARNPTRRFHSYFSGAPEIADLLDWCPPDGLGLQGIYVESLPWDRRANPTSGWGRGTKAYQEEQKKKHVANLLPDSRWLEYGREKQ